MCTLLGWRDKMRLFANTDDDGIITRALFGEFVVDLENEYKHHLTVKEEQVANLEQYKIKNSKLVKR